MKFLKKIFITFISVHIWATFKANLRLTWRLPLIYQQLMKIYMPKINMCSVIYSKKNKHRVSRIFGKCPPSFQISVKISKLRKKVPLLFQLVWAECVRYALPNAVATINTVILSLSMSMLFLNFCWKSIIYFLYWEHTYQGFQFRFLVGGGMVPPLWGGDQWGGLTVRGGGNGA